MPYIYHLGRYEAESSMFENHRSSYTEIFFKNAMKTFAKRIAKPLYHSFLIKFRSSY